MNSEFVRQQTEKAVELVSSVPVEYREAAFKVVLAELVRETFPLNAKTGSKAQNDVRRKDAAGVPASVEEILGTPIDYSAYHKQLSEGSWTDRAVIVLSVLEHELGVTALTPPELAKVFEEQVNLPFVHRQNIYRELAANRKYFIKAKAGKAHKYSLTLNGKQRFGEIAQKMDGDLD